MNLETNKEPEEKLGNWESNSCLVLMWYLFNMAVLVLKQGICYSYFLNGYIRDMTRERFSLMGPYFPIL